jgi:hypothetical protein
MPDNQIKGLIAVIILLVIISLTIEIQVKDAGKGIYFTPPGTTADQLLQ